MLYLAATTALFETSISSEMSRCGTRWLGKITLSTGEGGSAEREMSIGTEGVVGPGVGWERKESRSSRFGCEIVVVVLVSLVQGGEDLEGEKQRRRRVESRTYCRNIWNIGPNCLGWPNGISQTSRA